MKKQYLATERAHFMCPNMHFGILTEIDKAYHRQEVEATLARMADAHPFLKSLIAYEDGSDRLFYKLTDNSQITLSVKEDISNLWQDYEQLSARDWNVFENGMLKVFLYPREQGMTVLFAAHHLLTDGRGLAELVREFADDYVGGIPPVYVQEQLMESIRDLPEKSALSGISKLLVKRMNRLWEQENHKVTYEQYQSFVENDAPKHPVHYECYPVEEQTLAEMVQICRTHGVTMNDLLMAHMYEKTGTDKIIIAADIRDRFLRYRKGALGNYSTALGIHYNAGKKDLVTNVKAIHRLVQKKLKNNRALMLVLACYFEMDPTLLDAAAISALGGFESKAAAFVGEGMFGMAKPRSYSITNLGKMENQYIASMMFIPPVSPAAKLTLGVVTMNGTMKVCGSINSKPEV